MTRRSDLTSVLVVDDHPAVREGLRSLIRAEERLVFAGAASDAAEGLRLAHLHHPDVVILDNDMPGGSGLHLIHRLRTELPATKIVMFSLDSAVRERALGAGADTFVSKDASIEEILGALHRRE